MYLSLCHKLHISTEFKILPNKLLVYSLCTDTIILNLLAFLVN